MLPTLELGKKMFWEMLGSGEDLVMHNVGYTQETMADQSKCILVSVMAHSSCELKCRSLTSVLKYC